MVWLGLFIVAVCDLRGVRRVSPLLFRQHLSLRLLKACTHEVGRSIRNHTTSSLRNHRFSMARYHFYTRAKTLALCPLGIRVFVVEGLSSAFLRRPAAALPLSPVILFILSQYIFCEFYTLQFSFFIVCSKFHRFLSRYQ